MALQAKEREDTIVPAGNATDFRQSCRARMISDGVTGSDQDQSNIRTSFEPVDCLGISVPLVPSSVFGGQGRVYALQERRRRDAFR